ncbi:MAG: methylated-DNA--[protein]-cysteine S-methyltransferase [Chitinophagaceae bacterium]|jgi:methylated-DNA-[protein]-cysteine S-methyltransferase|nr:MAG: methylated-DNA--[protein]-cysteine S-methyltransferase [Chitinophagaceae bacterium]
MKTERKDVASYFYHSPVGWLKITASLTGLTGIWFCESKDGQNHANQFTEETRRQLQEYFEKKRVTFDLPLEMRGTDFQRKVWTELLNISFGKTISYMELSKRIGNVKAIRAVGHANGQNPLPIIVPCHRVIGSDGSLTGYGGGLWRKEWLLEHEGAIQKEKLLF